jgi:hypothetical protein
MGNHHCHINVLHEHRELSVRICALALTVHENEGTPVIDYKVAFEFV